jgi:hypothetical protein
VLPHARPRHNSQHVRRLELWHNIERTSLNNCATQQTGSPRPPASDRPERSPMPGHSKSHPVPVPGGRPGPESFISLISGLPTASGGLISKGNSAGVARDTAPAISTQSIRLPEARKVWFWQYLTRRAPAQIYGKSIFAAAHRCLVKHASNRHALAKSPPWRALSHYRLSVA